MTGIFGSVLMAVGAGTFTVLVKGGYVQRMDLLGWIGASLCSVGGLMTVLGAMLEAGNTDGVILLAVLFSLAALTTAIFWLMRHRPPASEPEPQQTQPTGGYVHAYGTYTRADVQAERRKAQQIRRGAHA